MRNAAPPKNKKMGLYVFMLLCVLFTGLVVVSLSVGLHDSQRVPLLACRPSGQSFSICWPHILGLLLAKRPPATFVNTKKHNWGHQLTSSGANSA